MDGELGDRIAEGRIATVHPFGDGRVLKLARDWVPSDWIEHEYRIGRTVFEAGVDVPQPLEFVTVLGRPAIVYRRVAGDTMLEAIEGRKLGHRRYGAMLGRLHAAVHAIDAPPELPDNLDRLHRRIESLETAPTDIRDAALTAVVGLPNGESVLHGDFHPGNVMLSPDGPVVIDWPDASRGHALGDVARTLVLSRIGDRPQRAAGRARVPAFRRLLGRAYREAYFEVSPAARSQLRAWLLPVLVARLSEEIDSERVATLAWARRLM